jgi:hypothetical protein
MKMQILNNRPVLVLCALGFLCASAGLVMAQQGVGIGTILNDDNNRSGAIKKTDTGANRTGGGGGAKGRAANAPIADQSAGLSKKKN